MPEWGEKEETGRGNAGWIREGWNLEAVRFSISIMADAPREPIPLPPKFSLGGSADQKGPLS